MFNIRKVDDADRKIHVNYVFQWFEWLPWRRYNWRNFDLARIACEYEICMGRQLEIEFVLIGVGIRVVFINRMERAKVMAQVDQIKARIEEELDKDHPYKGEYKSNE